MMEHGAHCCFQKNAALMFSSRLLSRRGHALSHDSTPHSIFERMLHAGAAASNDDLVAGLKRGGVIQRQEQLFYASSS